MHVFTLTNDHNPNSYPNPNP